MSEHAPIDPMCAFHRKRWSEHDCLYCCLCFRSDLTPEDCWEDENGVKWDNCKECKEYENEMMEKKNG